jgi:hypothetical protein
VTGIVGYQSHQVQMLGTPFRPIQASSCHQDGPREAVEPLLGVDAQTDLAMFHSISAYPPKELTELNAKIAQASSQVVSFEYHPQLV